MGDSRTRGTMQMLLPGLARSRPREYRPPRLAVPQWTVRVGHLYFALCATLLVAGWAGYVFGQRYRFYLVAWLACAALLPLFTLGRARIALRVPWRPAALLIAFHLFTLISAWWSPDPAVTIRWATVDLVWPLAFVVGVAWARGLTDDRMACFYEVVALTGVISVARFVWVYSDASLAPTVAPFRSAFAQVFSATLPFLIWRIRFVRSGRAAALAAFCVVCLLLSGSRSALLALPVALGGAAWTYLRTTRDRGWKGSMLVLFVLLAALVLASIPAVQRGVLQGHARFTSETSFSVTRNLEALDYQVEVDLERRLQAYEALRAFRERPWLGGGYMSVAVRTERSYGMPVSAHGLPFMLLGETGIVGTLLYGALLWGAFARVRARLRNAVGNRERSFHMTVMVTLAVILVIGLFHQVFRTPEMFVVLAFAYAADLPRRRRSGAPPGPPPEEEPVPEPPPYHPAMAARA